VTVRWIPVVIIALFSVGFWYTGAIASDLTVRAGFGYESLSQNFYEDSLLQAGGDSLAYLTALKTTYLVVSGALRGAGNRHRTTFD
jgi:hypothetical protein